MCLCPGKGDERRNHAEDPEEEICARGTRRKCSMCSGEGREVIKQAMLGTVFPDGFLKNLYKCCMKNPYRLKKFRTFFFTWVSN